MAVGYQTIGVAHGIPGNDHGGNPWHLDVRTWGKPIAFQVKTIGVAHDNYMYVARYSVVVCYLIFWELIKLLLTIFVYGFRYLRFKREGSGLITVHTPIFFATLRFWDCTLITVFNMK